MAACGGGGHDGNTAALKPASSETASATFSIQWQDRPVTPLASYPAESGRTTVACANAGVEKIYCHVYDEADLLIATGGPWDCAEGRGRIEEIPIGSGRKMVVLGLDVDGRMIYQGQAEGITINPQKITDAGTIDAFWFVPQLAGPAENETVSINHFSFQWEYIQNAETYHIILSEEPDFTNVINDFEVLRPEPANPGDPAPSFIEYKTTDILYDTSYHWKVYAIDSFGNESSDSAVWQFRTNPNQLPAVSISAPLDGDRFALGETIPFTGSAEDFEEGTLTGNSLIWKSDQQDQIGTGESISIGNLVLGNHQITLQAADSQKEISQVSINIVIQDREAPLPPLDVLAKTVSSNRIQITWSDAQDNVGVEGYRVYRNETYIGFTETTEYLDTGLLSNTLYCYAVESFDAAGNISARSDTSCSQTPADNP